MREIAREAKMPIATVYQYFPMKLAIVREMWTRYTSNITGALSEGIQRSLAADRDESNQLIGIIIDRMAQLQAANPAFIEIWSCVAASMELRAFDMEDTLHNARLVANFLQHMHPSAEPGALQDRALIVIEMVSSTTRFALCLPEPHRARTLQSLKAAVAHLVSPSNLEERGSSSPRMTKGKAGRAVLKSRSSKRGASARSGPSSK